MTDSEISQLLRRLASARDVELGAVPELPSHRLAALRADAREAVASAERAPAWRLLAACAAVVSALAGLGPECGSDGPPRQGCTFGSPPSLTPSALLAAARPSEASLLDEADIRFELAAIAPPRPTVFAISNDAHWPSVGEIALPGGGL